MRIRFTPRAIADLEAIHSYLVQQNPAAALRVRTEIECAIARLTIFPCSGPSTDEEDLRLLHLQHYPYRIFYRAEVSEILILHVRHTSRRPIGKDEL